MASFDFIAWVQEDSHYTHYTQSIYDPALPRKALKLILGSLALLADDLTIPALAM